MAQSDNNSKKHRNTHTGTMAGRFRELRKRGFLYAVKSSVVLRFLCFPFPILFFIFMFQFDDLLSDCFLLYYIIGVFY